MSLAAALYAAEFLIDYRFEILKTLPCYTADIFWKHRSNASLNRELFKNIANFEHCLAKLNFYLPESVCVKKLQPFTQIVHECRLEFEFYDPTIVAEWYSLVKEPSSNALDALDALEMPAYLSETSDTEYDEIADTTLREPTESFTHGSADSENITENIAETLLSLLLANKSFINDQKSEIVDLLSFETSLHRLRREQILIKSKKPYNEICRLDSKHGFLSHGRVACHCSIHFDTVVTSNTDVSLGDCSYLDTCYKSRTCKYVHYKVSYQNFVPQPDYGNRQLQLEPSPSFFETPVYGSLADLDKQQPAAAQWIKCDLREVTLKVLGKFAAIIADPPWDIHINSYSQTQSGTINDEQVASFELQEIQDEGVIFLWVTGRTLDIGRKCLAKWGYTDIEEIIWCKTNQLGRTICTGRTGHWLNHSKEHCLVGVKGDPSWLIGGIDIDVITSATREKSFKPDELYDIIDRMVGIKARKLELFGQRHNIRPGWLTLGDNLDYTHIEDKQLEQKMDLFYKR